MTSSKVLNYFFFSLLKISTIRFIGNPGKFDIIINFSLYLSNKLGGSIGFFQKKNIFHINKYTFRITPLLLFLLLKL